MSESEKVTKESEEETVIDFWLLTFKSSTIFYILYFILINKFQVLIFNSVTSLIKRFFFSPFQNKKYYLLKYIFLILFFKISFFFIIRKSIQVKLILVMSKFETEEWKKYKIYLRWIKFIIIQVNSIEFDLS